MVFIIRILSTLLYFQPLLFPCYLRFPLTTITFNLHKHLLLLHVSNSRFRPLTPPMHRYENVVEPWHDEPNQHESETKMREDEPCNHHGVVAQSVELWVREAEDDG